jgi:serine/threonine protein phosphatase PrpC
MNWFRRLFKPPTDDDVEVFSAAAETLPRIQDTPLSTEETQKAVPLKTRPLPPPKPFSSKSKNIRFGQASDVGQLRSNNQDASLAVLFSSEVTNNPPPIGFFVVADGMGGHHDGELASALTVQTLVREVVEQVLLPHVDGSQRTAEQKTIPEVLSDSMLAANQAVQEQVPSGGTTATCALIRGDLAYIAHVGDSRAYLISEGNLELITRDHSLVRRLLELGQLTPEEAEVHPQRNVLYRAVGQGETLEVDAATRRMPPTSRLLLCSDGLWGVIGDEKIAEILNEYIDDDQEACNKLITTANELGGPDNITAVLVHMPE